MTWNLDAFRAIRKAQKIGLRRLSRESGIDHSHLGKIDRGEVETPRPGTVKKIADALEVDPRAVDPDWVDPAAINPPDEETT